MNATPSTSLHPASVESSRRTFSKPGKVAERLGIHKNTVFRMIKAGRLARYVLSDGITVIADDEVDRLLESARVVATPAPKANAA